MKRIAAVMALAMGWCSGQAGAQTPAPGAGMAAQQAAPQAAPPSAPAPAPAPAAASAPVARPAARPADVASVDAIVAALYDVVSGPAGGRDWDRLRSLFTPDARMAAVGPRPGGGFALRTMTVDDYVARNSKAFAGMGFFESEVARSTETFGQLVHVFSTYQARHAPGDAKPFVRGVNSIQLVHDGERWYVANLIWRAEDDKLILPERYLRNR